jgi:hypothetical protein
MAVTAVEQLVATIESGTTFTWNMTSVNAPFNPSLNTTARPQWLVEWQAIPLVVEVGGDVLDHPILERPHRDIRNSKPGLQIEPVTVVQEFDTSLTHIVSIKCTDVGNPPPGMHFTVTYVLYAIFTVVK